MRIKNQHYRCLDGFRGIAISLVMVYHFSLVLPAIQSNESNPFLFFAQFGWAGVDLFFVLSGFLITSILIETKGSDSYLRNFWARRFLRIFPLYYASLVVFFIVAPAVLDVLPDQLGSMKDNQAWFWLYGVNWLIAFEGSFNSVGGGYFWSLAVEEQFYLVWPLVVRSFHISGLKKLCLGSMAFLLALRLILYGLGVSTSALYTMTITHTDSILAGVLVCLLMKTGNVSKGSLTVLRYVSIFLSLVIVAGSLWVGDFFFWNNFMATFGYSLIASVFGIWLLVLLNSDSRSLFRRFTETSVMVSIGQLSYAMYIVHPIVSNYLKPVILGTEPQGLSGGGGTGIFLGFMAVCFVATWLIAFLSGIMFERPILKMKKYFQY